MTRVGAFSPVEEEVVIAGRRLRLLRPAAPDALHGSSEGGHPPYWASIWPSSLALAAELLGRDLQDTTVLELGCGLGLGAIAATLAGGRALATDLDRSALAFARENGRRVLGRRLETMLVDFGALDGRLLERAPYDLVIAADVLYLPEAAGNLAAALAVLVRPGGEALVVHPWAAQGEGVMSALGWPTRQWDAGGVHLLSLTHPGPSGPECGTM